MNDSTLIFLGIMMLMGQIIIIYLVQSGSMKKLMFRYNLDTMKEEQKIRFTQLRKDLKLKNNPRVYSKDTGGTFGNIGGLLKILQGL